MKPAPFSRSQSIVHNARALVSMGVLLMTALMQAGAESYRSRGHGKGTIPGKRYGRSANYKGKYPFSSTKQDAKCAQRQATLVNPHSGFATMQTMKRKYWV